MRAEFLFMLREQAVQGLAAAFCASERCAISASIRRTTVVITAIADTVAVTAVVISTIAITAIVIAIVAAAALCMGWHCAEQFKTGDYRSQAVYAEAE